MKLYKYTFGDWEKYGAANDDADAEKRKADVDPQFHYVPVMIEEVKLEGYEIVVAATNYSDAEANIVGMTKEGLKEFLNEKNVPFHHTLGEVKLRELALQHI